MKRMSGILVIVLLTMFMATLAFAKPAAVESFDTAQDGELCNSALLSEIVLEGAGTVEQPYVISSAEEYYAFCQMVDGGDNACCVKLAEDIDFGGETISGIGSAEIPFSGSFDGNGKTLNNFVLSGTEYIGVFNYIDSATVENFYIGDFSVDLTCSEATKVYVGTVAYAVNSTISNVCVNNEALSLIGQTKYVYVAAICSYAESDAKGSMLIENCYNLSDITFVNDSGYGYIGGIVGRFVTNSGGNSVINHCYSVGDISAKTYNSANVGGLVGYLYSYGSACSPGTGSLSADVDVMIKNSFAVATVSASSTAYYENAGKIVGNLNAYASCDTSTTLYTTDASITVTGTAKTVGTGVALSSLQDDLYIASTLGFDFTNVWTPSILDTYKYPVFLGTQKTFDADETIDFLAVSSDVTVNSCGNVLIIDKIRIAKGHRLVLDRGTYIIGQIEGTAVVEADVNSNVIINGNNKPSNYVELDIGEVLPANVRFAEVGGNQYEIKADGQKYGILVNKKTMVEIVEKTSLDTAVASSKYFIANPDGTSLVVTELNDYMTSSDTYGIRLTDNMGMRFKAQIDAQKKIESESFEIVEYGYILTLTKYIDAANGAQLNFDFDGKLVSGVAYSAKDGIDLVFSTENGVDCFTAVLYDIPKSGYKQDVVAKTYTKVSVDGTEYVVYGEEMTSNLYEIALALDDKFLNDEQKAIVDEILNA